MFANRIPGPARRTRYGVRRLHVFNIPAPISAHESRVFMMFIAPPGANPPKQGSVSAEHEVIGPWPVHEESKRPTMIFDTVCKLMNDLHDDHAAHGRSSFY